MKPGKQNPIKFLKGEALSNRLTKLRGTVIQGHKNAVKTDGEWLDHVKAVGDALNEARKRLGGRLKWSRWRNATLAECEKEGPRFSLRTARVYAQIARKWDEPAVKAARKESTLTSINALLAIDREARIEKYLEAEMKDAPPEAQTEAKLLRQGIRQMFSECLRKKLKLDQLKIFDGNFHEIWDVIFRAINRRDVPEPDTLLAYTEMTDDEEIDYWLNRPNRKDLPRRKKKKRSAVA